MTALEVIDLTDELRPNSFSTSAKLSWIENIERRIEQDVVSTHKNAVPSEYMTDSDPLSELYAYPPSSELYVLYLCAMVDFYNGEYDGYNNFSIRFNTVYDEFLRHSHTILGEGST